jgi:hypothetical protein
MSERDLAPAGVDPSVPSPARLYDYYLGGTQNFEADRKMASALLTAVPDIADAALSNRGFHTRAAAWMARRGIRQFIDIGSGLPTQNNTHEAVQAIDPGAHVVYVDIDPIVQAHASELLVDDGTTAVVLADLRDPDAVLTSQELLARIDLSRPVGLLMTAVLHFVADESDPWGLVARYMAALAPGSYLALSHGTFDRMVVSQVQAGRDAYARSTANLYMRSRPDVERFFEGLELQPPRPGEPAEITYAGLWGAEDPEAADTDGSRAIYCAVARRS